mmetsp:Transcript_9609/g.23645  ORF Transcript_9609/g.23645 Transcript_9609/m.23645 type:complete len:336 (+) Transcript_9609:225-1232(+)
MAGDVLGASVEGFPAEMIRERYGPARVRSFVPCTHMGVRHLGGRYGMYTDDTNSTLALAESLAERKAVDPADCARKYAEWWQHKPVRGCPDSAALVFRAILNGMHHSKTGRIRFPDGSFANGGAMKIAPVGIACRNADSESLKGAAKAAIMATHVHPQAVDGAACIASAIAYAFRCKVGEFSPCGMVDAAMMVVQTIEMKDRLKAVSKQLGSERVLAQEALCAEDMEFLGRLGGLEFQIKAVHAVPQVLYVAGRFWKTPEEAVINMISVGGDTDTTGSMIAGIMGAIHGTAWIPVRWWDNLENGEFGRDKAIRLALAIGDLDIKETVPQIQTTKT